MKKTTFGSLLSFFIFLFTLLFTEPALAHGGEPRLEISVERINPGGVVEVRGVDFDYDEVVALSLMRSSIQIPLNDVTTDVEGIFTQVVVLPTDLPPGEYNFRARSDHHLITSPTIIVWGAAIQDQESSAIQDQSDMQFGPVPTIVPGAASTPVPQTSALELPVSKNNPRTLIYSVLAGIIILALLSIRILKRR